MLRHAPRGRVSRNEEFEPEESHLGCHAPRGRVSRNSFDDLSIAYWCPSRPSRACE